MSGLLDACDLTVQVRQCRAPLAPHVRYCCSMLLLRTRAADPVRPLLGSLRNAKGQKEEHSVLVWQ